MKIYNYNLLYNNYKNNLLNKLRAFGDGDELSLWVANEDISISVLNLIDALEDINFLIEFEQISYFQIKKEFLIKKLELEGKLIFNDNKFSIEFVRSSDALQTTVQKVDKIKKTKKENEIKIDPDENKLIKDDYLLNLKKIQISKNISGISKTLSSLIKINYSDDKCSLSLFVNPSNHHVVEGHFSAVSKNETIEIFAKYFINLIIDLPIDEAKDHLLIRIEYILRPVKTVEGKGIILKHTAGTIFKYFQEIINNLHLEYISKNNVKIGVNFYDYKIPEDWVQLSSDEKFTVLKKKIDVFNVEHCKECPLILVDIADSNRLFFSLEDKMLHRFNNRLFIKLERFLNDSLNLKFEVYYVNRKDENKLRTI